MPSKPARREPRPRACCLRGAINEPAFEERQMRLPPEALRKKAFQTRNGETQRGSGRELQCRQSWGLTFDMSGGPKGAKRPLGRPLDGGVRRLQSTLPACESVAIPCRCCGTVCWTESSGLQAETGQTRRAKRQVREWRLRRRPRKRRHRPPHLARALASRCRAATGGPPACAGPPTEEWSLAETCFALDLLLAPIR